MAGQNPEGFNRPVVPQSSEIAFYRGINHQHAYSLFYWCAVQ